ncbi:MAG: hypothetical protein M3O70_00495 [Actinomycetota bacterium]|nr:hypothetical protein [Actinomycetota bacterium]
MNCRSEGAAPLGQLNRLRVLEPLWLLVRPPSSAATFRGDLVVLGTLTGRHDRVPPQRRTLSWSEEVATARPWTAHDRIGAAEMSGGLLEADVNADPPGGLARFRPLLHFSHERMVAEYLRLYQSLLWPSGPEEPPVMRGQL